MAQVEKQANQDEGPRKFVFPSHQSHMLGLAKMCQANKDYTDCIIQCDQAGSNLRAHRLVLGSASPFLRTLFSEIPQSLPEATILVPGVKHRVVSALLDFLYTGEMTVDRSDTADLQRLIETLQINPDLITVDIVQSSTAEDKKVEKLSENLNATTKESSEKENGKLKDAEVSAEATSSKSEKLESPKKEKSESESPKNANGSVAELSNRKRKVIEATEEKIESQKKSKGN